MQKDTDLQANDRPAAKPEPGSKLSSDHKGHLTEAEAKAAAKSDEPGEFKHTAFRERDGKYDPEAEEEAA